MRHCFAILLRLLLLLPLAPFLGCDNGQVSPQVAYIPVNPAQNNGVPFQVIVLIDYDYDDDDDDDD
ncbi:hypothetical protein AYO40_05830 [Planctomycetaceae bacterium SCGC AG-212-D15]|nr:hypothetical protein AYO40_05830 [Planctomycetaceae bacterium SCGC AG-212-D15]